MSKIRHVGIVCTNIDAMKTYYENCGMKVKHDTTEKVRIIKFKEGIELLQYESMNPDGLRAKGISHVAFTIDPEGNYVEWVNKS